MYALSVITSDADPFSLSVVERCARLERVGSLRELRALLDRKVASSERFANLDLIGHSVVRTRFLRLGVDVIDVFDPSVEAFFRQLARDHVLEHLGVQALRLLGCSTASQAAGQRTLIQLARMLRVRVFGTAKLLQKSHYNAEGFDPAFSHLLVEASEVSGTRLRLSR